MLPIKGTCDGTEITEGRSFFTFMPMFEFFKEELDEHHDRRERIIKASRDITALSKKSIFLLQRVRTLNQPLPPKIATEYQERLLAIIGHFMSISPDLQSINAWRYQRQISSGIQEFIEAVSFECYLRTQSLMRLEDAWQTMSGEINLTLEDYILGIFDFVGELMRFAITTMATNGSLPSSKSTVSTSERTVLADLWLLRTCFEALDVKRGAAFGLGRDIDKKMEVMRNCVEKVEKAVYGMIVRGRERPSGWVPDLSNERLLLETY